VGVVVTWEAELHAERIVVKVAIAIAKPRCELCEWDMYIPPYKILVRINLRSDPPMINTTIDINFMDL
jgi:hypothetical protein